MKIVLLVALPNELPKEKIPNGIDVYYTGVGKINAAIRTTEIVQKYKKEDVQIINFGSAGSSIFKKGEIVKCSIFIQNDMDATPFAEKCITPFDELVYPFSEHRYIKFSEGNICYTQDKFENNPIGVCDMEAYAIAKVCKIYGFNFSSYKFISDGGNPEDWEVNHNKGVDEFIEILKALMVER